MNYKPVKYFFPSACGNCSLTWQWDGVQIGTRDWLEGKYAVHGNRGCAAEPIRCTSATYPNAVPKDGENPHGRAWCQAHVWELLARAGGRVSPQPGWGRGLGAGAGRERHSWRFCSCAAQGERCQTTHAPLASPITPASVSREPFHRSQWHLINIKLMWIKGDWDIYVSIPLYHWVWFYFCSHWFDIDTAPLASVTWICI